MAAKTLTIDGTQVSADESATILDAATDAHIFRKSLPLRAKLHEIIRAVGDRLREAEAQAVVRHAEVRTPVTEDDPDEGKPDKKK